MAGTKKPFKDTDAAAAAGLASLKSFFKAAPKPKLPWRLKRKRGRPKTKKNERAAVEAARAAFDTRAERSDGRAASDTRAKGSDGNQKRKQPPELLADCEGAGDGTASPMGIKSSRRNRTQP